MLCECILYDHRRRILSPRGIYIFFPLPALSPVSLPDIALADCPHEQAREHSTNSVRKQRNNEAAGYKILCIMSAE